MTLALGAFMGSWEAPAGILVVLPVIWTTVASVISLGPWEYGEYTHHFGLSFGTGLEMTPEKKG